MKTCSKCGRRLPASAFYRDSHRRDGLAVRCKGCDNARRTAHRLANREAEAARLKAWYAANREAHIKRVIANRKNRSP